MAGQLTSIALFIILTLGIGYSVLWLTRATREKNPLIALLEIAAVGIATWSFLGPVLDTLRIPLHITVYLAIALACPITAFAYAIKESKASEYLAQLGKGWSKTATACAIIAIIAGAFVFWMFHTGATSYPYLEDDDPWNHAQSTLYVALEHTARVDPAVRELNGGYAFYLDPYPPSYDIMMGVLRQANDSTSWTLKFFNALLCGLAVVFAYLAARAYLGGDQKGALVAIILAVLPSFMSHFIWSQTIAVTVFPIALFAAVKALDDKSWRIPAIIAVASMMVTQPVVSTVFGVTLFLLVALIAAHELMQPKAKKTVAGFKGILARFPKTVAGLIVGAGGLALSLIGYWIPQIIKWTWAGFLRLRGGELTSGWGGDYALQSYKIWTEVINPPMGGRIDQAIGWGLVLSVTLLLGILVILATGKRTLNLRKGWRHIHLLIWTALLTYAVLAPTFGMPGWGASRTWVYLAIPLAFLAAEGAFILTRTLTKSDALRISIVLLIAIGIISTSLPAKWAQQTNPGWPPGAQWMATQGQGGGVQYPELVGYLETQRAIPKNSRVYAMCGGDQRPIGFDFISYPWDPQAAAFRHAGLNHTPEETIAFLSGMGYDYVAIDISCVREHGENKTVEFTQALSATGRFQPVLQPQTGGFLLARLV